MAAKWVLLLSFLHFALSLAANDEFHEELLVRPLATGHVYVHFQFTTLWNVDITNKEAFSHFNLFPKPFGQIIDKYSVEELHLSLTQGRWQYDVWGYPVVSAPPGAELWAWFQDKVKDSTFSSSVNDNWSGLTQALGGQFCASLNFIDNKTSSSPQASFRREGVATSRSSNSSLLRYAALGREVVCTENLTPWKKLLPCDSKAGISTLFNALMMYNVNYHSMGIHLRPVFKDKTQQSYAVELQQTLSVVFDPLLRSKRRDWSFRKLFGRTIRSACPLAATSNVIVDITSNKTGSQFTLSPPPHSIINKKTTNQQHQEYALYDANDLANSKSEGNIVFKWKQRPVEGPKPQLHAHRFITGYGEEKGGITCLLYNNHPTLPLSVIYFATYPWFLRMFLHTLKIENGGKLIQPDHLHFVPGKDRQRPYTLELMFTLPANSITTLSIQFNRGFLKWTEHPPDAHHGFYISSAVISARLSSPLDFGRSRHTSLLLPSEGNAEANEDAGFVRLYTETLLIALPTPDFSMPYNVICLACTVIAIAFGSYHNLCTRRFEEASAKTIAKAGLAGKVKDALGRLKAKIFGTKEEEISQEKKDE